MDKLTMTMAAIVAVAVTVGFFYLWSVIGCH